MDKVDTGMGLGKEEDSSSFMTSHAPIRCVVVGVGSWEWEWDWEWEARP